MANDNDGSSGSTATITPIEVPTVAFSNTEYRKIEGADREHGEKEQGFSGVPGCGENTELKTGGSLRFPIVTVMFALTERGIDALSCT